MSGQVSRGSAGEYQADEPPGVAAQLASIRLMSRQAPSQNVRVLFLSPPKEIFLISYGNSDINILCSYFLPTNAAGYHEVLSFQ